MPNFSAAWIGMLAGMLAGAFDGLFFHSDSWRGGYSAWRRRMTRLGHVSFFGIGFINLAYALSVRHLSLPSPSPWPGALLIAGAVTMPLVCYLAAWRKGFRHLFFVPAGSVIFGTALFLFLEVLR